MITERFVETDTKVKHLRSLDFLWVELTSKCNLQCVHCYAESGPHMPLLMTMRYQDWQNLLSDAYTRGCRQVQFIGGEPLLHPNLHELIRDARHIGYEFIEVFTNGTMLNDSWFTLFREFDVNVAFSFYSADPTTHDAITHRKGSSEKTLLAIKRALNSELGIRVGVVIMPDNHEHLDRTLELLKSIGVTNIGVDRIRGIGRAEAISSNASQYNELCGACWKGKLCVSADGKVFPCVFSKFRPVGHINDGIDNILAGADLLEFRTRMYQSVSKFLSMSDSQLVSVPTSSNQSSQPCWPDYNCPPCGPNQPCRPQTCHPEVPCNPY